MMGVSMKNVQISFDENLLETIDSLALSARLSRSAIVREALRYWIKKQEIQEFEEAWIRKLNQNPDNDNAQESEAWMSVETWG